jgi:hypothetical protein
MERKRKRNYKIAAAIIIIIAAAVVEMKSVDDMMMMMTFSSLTRAYCECVCVWCDDEEDEAVE